MALKLLFYQLEYLVFLTILLFRTHIILLDQAGEPIGGLGTGNSWINFLFHFIYIAFLFDFRYFFRLEWFLQKAKLFVIKYEAIIGKIVPFIPVHNTVSLIFCFIAQVSCFILVTKVLINFCIHFTKLAELSGFLLQVSLIRFLFSILAMFDLMILNIVILTFQNLIAALIKVDAFESQASYQLLEVILDGNEFNISSITETAFSIDSNRTWNAKDVVNAFGTLFGSHVQRDYRKAYAALDLFKKTLGVLLDIILCSFTFTGSPWVNG